MILPPDCVARVYTGVLGKIIGVYLGRPFEGWTYEQILDRLGEVNYYVHERLAVSLIPVDSVIYQLIADIREWHAKEPNWHRARNLLAERYGYERYGGNCHMVPNHGLIILSLLYGQDDFQKSLMVVNTAGWDTDCNAGNLGCLLGIKNGLTGIDSGPDWRGPVADRLFLPTADGGRSITGP